MKNIKKMTKAVAGSALLVGATLAGAATMATASHGGSSGMNATLGDYPTPFIGEDGDVNTNVVVGADAKTVDVVGATNIAGQLGNDAMEETSVSEMGNFGWSADGGVTLDTQNDQLYYGSSLDSVRETLTAEHLQTLEDTTFRDDSGDETDVTSYLNIGNQGITFGNDVEALEDEDPALHVPIPTEGDVESGDGNHVYNLQANFEDSINFSSEDVKGEEIELFGRTYTVSSNDNDATDDELVLYGSSQEVNLDSGESTTVTVDEEEHTVELVGITSDDSPDAVLNVNGERQTAEEDGTFTLGDTQVRVDDVFSFDSDDMTDSVTLSIGSEELRLSDESAVQDEDGDDVEGTYVEFTTSDVTDGDITGISSIDVYVGGEDDNNDAVLADESFSHSLFENVEVHFGGLNPNVAEGGDNVGEVEVSTNGDDTATVDFTGSGGDSSTVEYVYNDGNGATLADSDENSFTSVEGQNVTEDEYFTSDAGDFSHLWQVSNVDRDDGENETTFTLNDQVSGDSVDVELESNTDADSDGDYVGTEVIDGQTYHFWVSDEGSSDEDAEINVAWGESADAEDGGVATGHSGDGATSVYTPVDTDSNAAVAFHQGVTIDGSTCLFSGTAKSKS